MRHCRPGNGDNKKMEDDRFIMENVKRIYVEKKEPFAVKARELKEEIQSYLNIAGVEDVRVLIRYDVENLSEDIFEAACRIVFSEPPVDILYRENFDIPQGGEYSAWNFSRDSLTSGQIPPYNASGF